MTLLNATSIAGTVFANNNSSINTGGDESNSDDLSSGALRNCIIVGIAVLTLIIDFAIYYAFFINKRIVNKFLLCRISKEEKERLEEEERVKLQDKTREEFITFLKEEDLPVQSQPPPPPVNATRATTTNQRPRTKVRREGTQNREGDHRGVEKDKKEVLPTKVQQQQHHQQQQQTHPEDFITLSDERTDNKDMADYDTEIVPSNGNGGDAKRELFYSSHNKHNNNTLSLRETTPTTLCESITEYFATGNEKYAHLYTGRIHASIREDQLETIRMSILKFYYKQNDPMNLTADGQKIDTKYRHQELKYKTVVNSPMDYIFTCSRCNEELTTLNLLLSSNQENCQCCFPHEPQPLLPVEYTQEINKEELSRSRVMKMMRRIDSDDCAGGVEATATTTITTQFSHSSNSPYTILPTTFLMQFIRDDPTFLDRRKVLVIKYYRSVFDLFYTPVLSTQDTSKPFLVYKHYLNELHDWCYYSDIEWVNKSKVSNFISSGISEMMDQSTKYLSFGKGGVSDGGDVEEGEGNDSTIEDFLLNDDDGDKENGDEDEEEEEEEEEDEYETDDEMVLTDNEEKDNDGQSTNIVAELPEWPTGRGNVTSGNKKPISVDFIPFVVVFIK